MTRHQRPLTVWVMGASSGLGKATALAAQAAGHRVIAGARSFQRGDELPGITCLPLDVRSEASIAAFRAAALAHDPRVDAVIQCAGMLVLGSCEETSLQEYHTILDTNFLGMVRVNQAVLPLMRQQGGGKIILFSSVNGLLGIPFQSAYTASKHAIEGYAECLQLECAPYGIDLCLVEPGDHRSGSDAYRRHAKAMTADSPYAGAFASTTAIIHRDEARGGDPNRLGKRVVKLLQRKKLPFRKPIVRLDERLAILLHTLLPMGMQSRILGSHYMAKKPK